MDVWLIVDQSMKGGIEPSPVPKFLENVFRFCYFKQNLGRYIEELKNSWE